jgi:hypothetical protein
MLQYEIKPATTHVSLVTGWLLTIGGIIGLVLPILACPFSCWAGDFKQALSMGAMSYDVAVFIVWSRSSRTSED